MNTSNNLSCTSEPSGENLLITPDLELGRLCRHSFCVSVLICFFKDWYRIDWIDQTGIIGIFIYPNLPMLLYRHGGWLSSGGAGSRPIFFGPLVPLVTKSCMVPEPTIYSEAAGPNRDPGALRSSDADPGVSLGDLEVSHSECWNRTWNVWKNAAGNGVEEKLSTEKPSASDFQVVREVQTRPELFCPNLDLGPIRWTTRHRVRLWWWFGSEH